MEESDRSECKSTESSDDIDDSVKRLPVATKSGGRLLVGNVLRTWAEVSKLNYMDDVSLNSKTRRHSVRLRSFAIACKELHTTLSSLPNSILKKTEEIITEEFPHNVTSLMNEDHLWGCFYMFPELYEDVYSPVVRILELREVAELVEGVLTRDMVAACLTYLRRTPILGDFVYIKLNLSRKRLIHIDILQHYKYLVYLDLSSNLLKDIKVLSHLLYLQYLSVDFNRLETVLEYSTPQWFLTEVHYKYNSVKNIRDLEMFWSITVLDLSHNNIKCISGLESLRYLRHLDLSFNHIQRLESLNNLRLLWLDVSYNNISTYELGPDAGLWTLLHLDYLNLNENRLKSMKMFSGCTRLRELYVRNNRLGSLLELAVYMRQMRRLTVLDLRANPICTAPGYTDVVFNTFPLLLNLDATKVDPVYQRSSKMDTLPDVNTFACRRLLRLLYVEQLSRARVSVTPPADTQEVPLVVLVGQEAVGKGCLARKLAAECGSKIVLARQHTTATFHTQGHFIQVSQQKFDDMLLAGDFLTYSEMDGESYGLSREEAFISDGKVRICSMDLIGALMLKQRGRRPYLILATCHNVSALAERQLVRKRARIGDYERRMLMVPLPQASMLQVLVSGRIIINGILNEIILTLPDDKDRSEFALGSECSLFAKDVCKSSRNYVRGADLLSLLSVSSSDSSLKSHKTSHVDLSMYSIYKQSQDSSVAVTASLGGEPSRSPFELEGITPRQQPSSLWGHTYSKATAFELQGKPGGNGMSRGSALRFDESSNQEKYIRRSSTWKGGTSTKSSKSVTFTNPDVAGMTIDPNADEQKLDPKTRGMSISTKFLGSRKATDDSPDDMELWLEFLSETGLVQASDIRQESPVPRMDNLTDSPESIMRQLNFYNQTPASTLSSNLRDAYEDIHRLCPGLFHDTVAMDDPKKAFHKAKQIIREIVNPQNGLCPMFDIDFAKNIHWYPTVDQRLEDIRKEIAPRQIFY